VRGPSFGGDAQAYDLGDYLLEDRAINAADLAKARILHARTDARLDEILIAHRMTSAASILKAYGQKYGAEIVNIQRLTPDPTLVSQIGAGFCVRHNILPWRQFGANPVILTSRPDQFERIRTQLPERFQNAVMGLADADDIQESLLRLRRFDMVAQAETRVAEKDSCRTWQAKRILLLGLIVACVMTAAFVSAPRMTFALLCAWATVTLIMNMWLKAHAAYFGWKELRWPKIDTQRPSDVMQLRQPVVSVMVPLFKEKSIASTLVTRLATLQYPKHLLDVVLVTEDNDSLTKATLEATDLPGWMRIVVVPKGTLRTKPRALNYALDFCRGSIIGVYDAEDAPAPDQIEKVVAAFHTAPPQVACLQGVLDFYNRRTNWLSRCFAVEYATWFRMVLPGLARLGFVIPLGGTTVFLRRAALESLGGWDAHNVTEDADLGVRLARRGYKTQLVHSITQEEANCRAWPWVKQRSRWLKGYAVTYGVHMRDPVRLWRDLGAWRFFGFQLLFLGALSQFVLAPILWSFWALPLGLPHPLIGVLPTWGFWVLGGIFALSELTTIAVGVCALPRKTHGDLIKWVPTLHFYYPLGALASYKGLWELMVKPFYWDKTAHGVFKSATQAQRP